jgi:hypothetical protein
MKDLMARVGKKGWAKITTGRNVQLTVPVLILDARKVFNRSEYQVTPLRGTGEAWVAASAVETALERRAK